MTSTNTVTDTNSSVRETPIHLNPLSPRRLTHAFIDFDGTVSLLRSGWWLVMTDVALDSIELSPNQRASMRKDFIHEVLVLNGKPPSFQLGRLAKLILERTGTSVNPETLEDSFREHLGSQVERRLAALKSGNASPADFLVHGVLDFLQMLQSRDLVLHLVTGTDQPLVELELIALGVKPLFSNRVYGPGKRSLDFSKRAVFEEIIEQESLSPDQALVVGDGFVEIQIASDKGMPSFGIACDESQNGSGRLDDQRVSLLRSAQADIIIPDFGDAITLFESLHLS